MLTDTKIKNAKPEGKPVKLTDGGGLYLEITPSGGKHWRYRFRLEGKESLYAIGEYPAIKAAQARQLRDEAKALVKQGTASKKGRCPAPFPFQKTPDFSGFQPNIHGFWPRPESNGIALFRHAAALAPIHRSVFQGPDRHRRRAL
jgi:hypothetical protein